MSPKLNTMKIANNFFSVGKSYGTKAFLYPFGINGKKNRIVKNRPPYPILHAGYKKKQYYVSVLSKFIDEIHLLPHLALASEDEDGISTPNDQDFVKNYSLCLLNYYFILLDFKNAVREGSVQRLATLHKLLVPHLKSLPRFNAYAIEMMISVIQSEVLLSVAETHQCISASTANWKEERAGKSIEIDFLQESRNKDIKKSIKTIRANKTDLAIE